MRWFSRRFTSFTSDDWFQFGCSEIISWLTLDRLAWPGLAFTLRYRRTSQAGIHANNGTTNYLVSRIREANLMIIEENSISPKSPAFVFPQPLSLKPSFKAVHFKIDGGNCN
jgi:hypothetical protein